MRITANILILLIAINMLLGCGSPKNDAKSKTISANKIKTKPKNSHRDIADSTLITPLPFGPELLITYKFPKDGWESSNDPTEKKEPGITLDKKLDEIFDVANKINWSTKNIQAPAIKKIEYIYISEDSLITKHADDFKSDFKYRLPDLGPYECFYQSHFNENAALIKSRDKKRYNTLGNLVLFDKITGLAKILNIYSNYIYDEEVGLIPTRMFVIDKKGAIHLFEEIPDESSIIITPTQIITITEDGRVLIDNLKQ